MKEKICIDAGKLADRIAVMSRQKIHQNNVLLFKNNISALITDSIDLNITWVDGLAEWGRFTLEFEREMSIPDGGYWSVHFDDIRIEGGEVNCQSGGQQACEKALRGIILGIRE